MAETCGDCFMTRELTKDELESYGDFDYWCEWIDVPVRKDETPAENHCYDLPEDRI